MDLFSNFDFLGGVYTLIFAIFLLCAERWTKKNYPDEWSRLFWWGGVRLPIGVGMMIFLVLAFMSIYSALK